jgi:hypothetical protein
VATTQWSPNPSGGRAVPIGIAEFSARRLTPRRKNPQGGTAPALGTRSRMLAKGVASGAEIRHGKQKAQPGAGEGHSSMPARPQGTCPDGPSGITPAKRRPGNGKDRRRSPKGCHPEAAAKRSPWIKPSLLPADFHRPAENPPARPRRATRGFRRPRGTSDRIREAKPSARTRQRDGNATDGAKKKGPWSIAPGWVDARSNGRASPNSGVLL